MTETLIFLPLVATGAALYARRWRLAGDVSHWHLLAFAAGALTVLAAVQGPLYRLAEERLAVAHVIVLILLIHAAPFCFVRAVTPGILGRHARRVTWAASTLPPVVPLALLAAVAYGWHLPPVFDAAAGSPMLAGLQHASFVAVGVLAWSPISGHASLRPPLRGLSAFLYMTGDELILGALGIVLTWAPEPLYEVYVDAPRAWGLSVGSDQAVAGAVLTVVEEAPMAVALGVVFIRMLERDEAELREEERSLDEAGSSRRPGPREHYDATS